MKKFFVIGSNSFSGSSFINYILSAFHDCYVVGISRSKEYPACFLPYKNSDKRSSFEFHMLDLNRDTKGIVELIAAHRPDYIVNFAAQSMVAQSWDNPIHWVDTNVVSISKLLHEIYRFDFIKKFVQISTPEVYGSCNNTKVSMCFAPSTPYAATKAAADMMLYGYCSTHRFPVVYTRASNVYGPFQQLYRIIPKTVMCIKKGIKLPLHGGGKSSRNFIHIDDVAAATLTIALEGRIGDIYHISGERLTSIEELVRLVCTKMRVRFEDAVESVDDRSGKDNIYSLNTDKLRSELGWSDKISLDKGIDETIDWVNRYYDELCTHEMEYIHKS